MIGALRYAVPGLLLLFFAVRSFRQRVFLLGIPFLMYMGNSVFFEKAKPFWIPSRLSPSDHVMLWLVITWVVYFDLLLPSFRRSAPRPRLFGPALSSPEEIVLVGLAAFAVVEVGLTALRFSAATSALGQAKGFVYLFVGYFLLRGMLCRASREDSLDFVKALVVVNTIAAALFIVHQGLHHTIYLAVEYQTVVFMGQRLTRSFYFMPQLLTLALAYVFARRTWTVFWVGVLIVTLGALWVSYTRSLLVIAVAVFLTSLAVRLFKARQAHIAIRRAVTMLVLAAVLLGAAFVFLPVESRYLVSRIVTATSSGSLTSDPNLQNRQNKLRNVYAWIGPESHALGQGFATPAQDPPGANVPAMSADLVWVPVLYRFGLLGVLVVALLYATAGWRAARMSVSGDGDAEFLALVLLGVIVGTFLESFVSWTFLNPVRYPMGLWVFALLAAEACRRRAKRAAPAPILEEALDA